MFCVCSGRGSLPSAPPLAEVGLPEKRAATKRPQAIFGKWGFCSPSTGSKTMFQKKTALTEVDGWSNSGVQSPWDEEKHWQTGCDVQSVTSIGFAFLFIPSAEIFLCLLVLFHCSFSDSTRLDSTREQQKHWQAALLSVLLWIVGGVVRPSRPKAHWWYGTILVLITSLFFQLPPFHLKCPLVPLLVHHLLFGWPFSLWTSHPHDSFFASRLSSLAASTGYLLK